MENPEQPQAEVLPPVKSAPVTLEDRIASLEEALALLEQKVVTLANQTTPDGLTLSAKTQAKLADIVDSFYGGVDG
jgi:uncharacterized coiled-coil protein SlyX